MEGAIILAHPNIPKPLHGLAPRGIYGQAWFNEQRKIAYAQKSYRCHSCGIHKSQAPFHQWLEAHETYDVDYENGKSTFTGIVALCHSCHNFIHSGRLYALMKKGEISRDRAYAIVDRGLDLCFEQGVTPFIGLKDIVDALGIPWSDYWEPPESHVPWSDWRLVVDGKEYPPLHGTIEDWADYYDAEIEDTDREKFGNSELLDGEV